MFDDWVLDKPLIGNEELKK